MFKVEPLVQFLGMMLILSVISIFAAVAFFPSHTVLFTVMAGLMNNIAGALFLKMKIKSDPGDPDHVDVPGPKMVIDTPSGTATMEGPKS